MDITTKQAVSLTTEVRRTEDDMPAQFVGIPTWLSSDVAVAVSNAALDGLSTEVASVGPGTAVITCKGRAKPGDDDAEAEDVEATFSIQVIAGAGGKVRMVITPGVPYDKAAPPAFRQRRR